MHWLNTISPYLDLTETICVIAGTLIAIRGLNTWRLEIIGRKKVDLAEEMLANFYEARDIFLWVRLPGSFSNEGQKREKVKNENEQEELYRNALYVPIERLQQHHEFFAKLQSLKYRSIAYFGEHAALPFDKTKQIHNQIIISARSLIRTDIANKNKKTSETEHARRRRLEAESNIGWWAEERDDTLSPMIDDVIKEIEEICRPYLLEINT